jgi:ABC-type sugar transport system permease subunit
MKSTFSFNKLREPLTAYAFLFPSFIGLVVFILYPLVNSFFLSFQRWDMLSDMRFIGLRNYQKLFDDTDLHKILGNTGVYTVSVVMITLVLALAIAILLNQKLRGRIIFRTTFFLPVVMSLTAVSAVWLWIYDPEFGLANWLLKLAGLPTSKWMNSPQSAMTAIIVMMIWQTLGYNIIIFLAGLTNIRRDLYEAASLDGAGAWATFWNITLPLLSPTLVFLIITSTIQAFRVFDPIFVMSGGLGGPANSTATVVFYLYRQAFYNLDAGYASAIAFLVVAIAMVFTVLQLYLSRRWVTYE